jgi:hypothetical protein
MNLKTLDLSILLITIESNKIGDNGAKYISKGNWNLTSLNLCINEF